MPASPLGKLRMVLSVTGRTCTGLAWLGWLGTGGTGLRAPYAGLVGLSLGTRPLLLGTVSVADFFVRLLIAITFGMISTFDACAFTSSSRLAFMVSVLVRNVPGTRPSFSLILQKGLTLSINQLIIYFKKWLPTECRVLKIYTHVDKLYKNAGKIHVNMVTQNGILSHDLNINEFTNSLSA